MEEPRTAACLGTEAQTNQLRVASELKLGTPLRNLIECGISKFLWSK